MGYLINPQAEKKLLIHRKFSVSAYLLNVSALLIVLAHLIFIHGAKNRLWIVMLTHW